YNDLCQYPVFPWVLSDYESPTIDLQNPLSYRDLSKPMGALNPDRLNEFLERWHSFEEDCGIPAFMYGSHYSTMVGVVLHFLVRLQPFAALHKEMQNGHFDVPDRLFSSVPRTYKHNTTQMAEVKELTPEWFTTPDMFRNVNNFSLGCTQEGEVVGDVELPPWAATPEEFVRINRLALESDYVSQNLHLWVDLIFGCKQRGPEAVEAHNVFYYLTYYGSV
ncbi:BEACH domain-containing protein, partial [Ochromonadaceae sp. CCMP2298]